MNGIYSKLPSALGYFRDAALKFGHFQFSNHVSTFLEDASETDLNELATVGERFRISNHAELLNDFLDMYPITEYEQSSKLYFFLGVLDAAGIQTTSANPADAADQILALQKFGSERLASERAFAARMLGKNGNPEEDVINALAFACSDEDERVRVWAHFGLANLKVDFEKNFAAIRGLFLAHDEKDDFDCYDDVGSEAFEAIQNLS